MELVSSKLSKLSLAPISFRPEMIVDPLAFPFEIVAQIFCHAVQQFACKPEGHWVRNFSPLQLGKVCHTWRQLAWSTPELWSTIIITLKSNRDTDKDSGILPILLEEWLDRAGPAQDLMINFYSEAPEPSEEGSSNALQLHSAPVRMLRLLGERSMQWSTVAFHMPFEWFNLLGHVFGKTVKIPCPRLRSFSLGDYGDPTQSNTTVDLTDAPLLKRLAFHDSALALAISSLLKLRTQQIVSVDFLSGAAIPQHLRRCLFRFPNLQGVAFNQFRPIIDHPPFGQPSQIDWSLVSTHYKITSLELVYADSNIQRLLLLLTLPALNYLKIAVPGKSPHVMMESVWPMIDRSKCKLNFLYLEVNICGLDDEQDIYEFLSNVPDLKRLHVRDPFHSSNGLSSLFFKVLHPSWAEAYLPYLESFSYEGPLCAKPQEFLRPLILRARLFIDNRYDSGETAVATELKRIRIKADQNKSAALANSSLHPETLEDLLDLIEMGVVVLSNRDGTMWNLGEERARK